MRNNLIRFTQDADGKQTVTDMQGNPIDGVRSLAIVAEAGKQTRVVAELCAMAVELHGMPVVFDRDRLIETLLERIEGLKAENSTLKAGNLEVSCKAQAFDMVNPQLARFNEMINKGEILRDDDGPWTNSVLEIVDRYVLMLKGQIDSLVQKLAEQDRELRATRAEADVPTIAAALATIARNHEDGRGQGGIDAATHKQMQTAINKMVENLVKTNLMRQQKPGGMLYAGTAPELPTVEQLEAGLAEMAPYERALELTKLSQQLPEPNDTPVQVADDGAETDADRFRRLARMLEKAKVTLWSIVNPDAFWTQLVGEDPCSQLKYIRERARVVLKDIENDGLKAMKRAQSKPIAEDAAVGVTEVESAMADVQRMLDHRAVSHRILAEALARVAEDNISTGHRTFARNVLLGLQLKPDSLLPRCIVSVSGEGHLHPTLAEVGVDITERMHDAPIFVEPSVAATVGYPPLQAGRMANLSSMEK